MRTRERSLDGGTEYQSGFDSVSRLARIVGVTPGADPGLVSKASSGFEHMEDEVGSRSVNHPCSHTRSKTANDLPIGTRLPNVTTLKVKNNGTQERPKWEEYTHVINATTILYPYGQSSSVGAASRLDALPLIPELAVRCLGSGIPRFSNIALATLELRDIPKTIKSLRDLVLFVRRQREVYEKQLMRLADRRAKLGSSKVLERETFRVQTRLEKLTSPRATVKQIAMQYLAYTFGIAPTVRDVRTFIGRDIRALQLAAEPNRLAKGSNLRAFASTKVHSPPSDWTASTKKYVATRNIRGKLPGVFYEGYVPSFAGSDASAIDAETWGQTPVVYVGVAEALVYGRLKEDVEVSLSQKFLYNMPPLSTAWELTPMSFVIDWFIDVGRWIRTCERGLYSGCRLLSLEEGAWVTTALRRRKYRATSCQVTDNRAWSHSNGVIRCERYLTRTLAGYRQTAEQLDFLRTPLDGSKMAAWPKLTVRIKPYMIGTGAALFLQRVL